jgi:3',5'-nucleoside bisphosphate phosphatase
MPVIDLHCHTTASDGTLSGAELVRRAALDHVDVIAVTDHDTVDGIEAAQMAGESNGVRVVAGIEVSSRHEGRNVHMLGYFLDPQSRPLLDALAEVREDRVRRAVAIVERLCELGFPLSMDDVNAQAHGDVVARPHIARALVALGHVSSVREAFSPDLLADGGRADIPKRVLSAVEAVAVIRTAGGAAVIAHPCVGHHEGQAGKVPLDLLRELRGAGLAGLEVEHPDHPPLLRDELHRVAKDLDLIPTGGSDFHGEAGQVLGLCRTSEEALDRLSDASA